MAKKIAILGNISSLVKEENESGGEAFERNVIKRLAKQLDALLIPTIYDLWYIFNNEDLSNKIKSLSRTVNISNVIFDILDKKSFNIEYILKKYIEEIKSEGVVCLYQPDYFAPHALINTLLRAKSYKYLRKLMYGETVYLADKLKIPSIVEIHGLADISFKRLFIKFLKYKIKYKFDFNLFDYKSSIKFGLLDVLHNRITNKLTTDSNIKKILVVSRGVLDYLGIKSSEKVEVMVPANAVDEAITNYRRVENKCGYGVFFARLIPFKGVLEIPYIIKYLKKLNVDLKIKILGKFYDEYTKKKFYDIASELNVEQNIEYLGFVPKQKLYEIVSKAKIMIYPSHSDAFSLSILESIALGTPVIAYDIAGPKSVFNGLPSVIFSKEFDVYELAEKTSKILNLNDFNYTNLLTNQETERFLKQHTSWDNVTIAIYNELRKTCYIS